MKFYTTEKVTEHIYRIRPFWNDACMYYIKGDTRGLLVDTGYGFGHLKEYVDSEFHQPYEVVLSHGHLDHANGAGEWDRVYMSHKDLDLYHEHADIQNRKQFLKRFVPNIAAYEESMFPEEYEKEFLDLENGKEFDLHTVHVQCIAAPGHTRGMFVFLIKEDRTMLFGDACGVFTLFVSQESTSLEEYQTTLDVLKSFRNEYDRILRQHGTCESPVSLLDEDMEIVHSILEGTDDQMPYVFNGIPCFIARKTDQEHGNVRIDGKQGNVVYIKEKIWKESE